MTIALQAIIIDNIWRKIKMFQNKVVLLISSKNSIRLNNLCELDDYHFYNNTNYNIFI